MVRENSNERLAFFRSPLLPGTEVMAVYESTEPWHMFHVRYAFCICKRASAGVRYRGRDDLVGGGQIYVREPGETHYNTFIAKPLEFKTVFVEPSILSAVATELDRQSAFHFPRAPINNDSALFRSLDELCSALEAAGERLELQCLFAAAIGAVARHAERASEAPASTNIKSAVARAKAHLKERFNESVTLDELAAVSRVSRFHLVHAFTRETGLPPHAYQIHIRVERARDLLQKGASATSAAAAVGFADQSHLTRWFKRIMGVTPSDYARATAASSISKFLPARRVQRSAREGTAKPAT